MPVPNKYREAKQVYKCGAVHLYIDTSVIFVQASQNGPWAPKSLSDTLKLAVGK